MLAELSLTFLFSVLFCDRFINAMLEPVISVGGLSSCCGAAGGLLSNPQIKYFVLISLPSQDSLTVTENFKCVNFQPLL